MWRLTQSHLKIAIVLLLLGLSACGDDAIEPTSQAAESRDSFETTSLTPTPSPTMIGALNARFFEAPMLAEQVAAGELPPVDERLPLNPRVIPVYESIGQYGGTWRRAYTGLGDRFGPTKLIEERIIEFYMPDAETILLELNWADQFEPNADSSAFTAHIREGLRWSDGVAVTTADVRFWYEDVLMNEAFFPVFPSNLIVNGERARVEIIDDYTFVIQFAAPYPLFPMLVARDTPGAIGLQGTSFVLPFHYLKNYHPNYVAEDELAAIAADYGVEQWLDLWGEGPIQAWWLNPELPILGAWTIQTPPPANPMVMVRNPYYHAVDAEGHQLPYIDEIVHALADESETVPLWAIQGLIDLQGRHIGGYDVLKRNESQGNYHVVTWISGTTRALYPNLNTQDPVLAALFNDVRFRHALSIALDRSEILEVSYAGLGEARQASPVSGSPQFDAEFEQKWTDYDPHTANALLDEIGLTERDGDGYRLRPDGDTLSITIATRDSSIYLGLVQDYWAAIGIKVELEVMERLEFEAHAQLGDLEMGEWEFDRNVVISADPGRYLGTITDGPWAPLYGQWYESGGEIGIEPPLDHAIREVWAAWERARSALTIEEARVFVQEMIDIHKDNIWVIGLVGERPSLYIVSNNIHNFPERLIHETTLRDIGLAQPAQFYFSNP
jgi:peptide/nickel transport system substrate-binding protein